MQTTIQSTTLTITESRLQPVVITVTTASDAEITLYTPPGGGNTWYALAVDDQITPLVLWKHTIGRPEVEQALSRVLAQVQAAIGRLQEL